MKLALPLFTVLSALFVFAGCATPCRCQQHPADVTPTAAAAAAVAQPTHKTALVYMTDFGLKDGAVSEMKGVAFGVSPDLFIADVTHEIPPYNIWEGAYRLVQTYKYWPKGTVFVTVVDPGVGSSRRSIVARTRSGHFFVGPDNGLYTLLDDESGMVSVRVLDESTQRLKGSEESNTFHGRDLYSYVGARLASGQLLFEDAGPEADPAMIKLKYQKPEFVNGELRGLVPILDSNYGNVWTNLPKKLVDEHFANAKQLLVRIFKGKKKLYEARLPLTTTFAAVPLGKPLLYINSLLNLSLALNQGDFAKVHKIQAGPDWTITVSK